MLDGQLGRVQVEHAQQADQVLDADVRQLDEHAERAVQDAVVAARHVTAAPVPHLDQARRRQGAERLANRRRAHPERRRQLALGRQPAARRVRTGRDLRPQFVEDLAGDPRPPDPASVMKNVRVSDYDLLLNVRSLTVRPATGVPGLRPRTDGAADDAAQLRDRVLDLALGRG
jgi:hypothetical protein